MNMRIIERSFESCKARGLKRIALITIAMLLIPVLADGATLGLPETTARIGYAAGPAYVSIDQANSARNSTWATAQSLIYTDWFMAGTRYWAALRYGQADLDGTVSKIGEHMTFYGARVSIQDNVRFAPGFSPWVGAGLDVSVRRHTRRYTVDSDGYLAEQFPEQTTRSAGLVLNAIQEWAVGRTFHVSASVEQLIDIAERFRETTLAAAILYRF